MSRARERPGYSIAGPKLRQERLSFSLQALRSRGEVVNAAVCKTAMHGCESHRDLKIDDDRLYACDMFPIDLLTILCRIFMSGQEHDARRHVAVSERNPQGRRHANTGGDPQTSANMRNWMECVRSRKTPNASIEAGYNHSVALCMNIAAIHTGQKVTFDDKTQQVMAGGKVYA